MIDSFKRDGMLSWYRETSSETRWVLWLWAGVLLLVCLEQSHWWRIREDYLFGFLALPFSWFVLGERKGKILGILQGEGSPHWTSSRLGDFIAWVLFGGALASVALGALVRWAQGHSQPASLLFSLAFPCIVFSSVWLYGKGKDGRPLPPQARLELVGLLAFPALVWLMTTPILSFLEKQLSLFLLRKVTVVVFTVFEVLGLFVEQRGNTLLLPKGLVGVADACSGIRSLMACIFAGSFLGAVYFAELWKKGLFVVLACVFAFVFNIGRSLFLTFWAYKWGAASIKGTVHDVTGFAVLGLTGLCLFMLVPLVEGRWIRG